MTKNKSEQKASKRKKLPSSVDEVCVEQTKECKKRVKVEEAPVQTPDIKLPVEEEPKTKNKKKHKKKQKKKQITEQTETTVQIQISDPAKEEDLSPEERRILERKMKKIMKKKLKAEGIIPVKSEESGPTASQQALDYLTSWAHNREAWRFQKKRQTWLLQNMFDSEQIEDEKFSLLLQYMEGLRGGSRDTTVQKALVLVQESGEAPEDVNVQKRAHRAREVIQMLS